MQAMIGVVGLGIGIPKTNLGVGAANMVKLYFRHSLTDKSPVILDFLDIISIGGKSGAFLISAFSTEWFELNPKTSGWAHNPYRLIGKKLSIEVDGLVAVRGNVDVSIRLFNNYDEGQELLNRCCIPVLRGLQFSGMKVRGTVSKSAM